LVENKKIKNKKMEPFSIFISTLFQSRTQSHIYHLQTNSFAAHKALQEYYEEIVELADGLVESYQGRYGILRGYKMENAIKEDDNPIMYFEALCKFVEVIRTKVPQLNINLNSCINVRIKRR
jgi:hypothetical protein